MRIVIALGGSAFMRDAMPRAVDIVGDPVARAAAATAALRRAGHDLVLTHGVNPNAGVLALHAASTADTPYPLQALDAPGVGMIGHLIERALSSVEPEPIAAATLLTQTLVDRADPAFQRPATPVGESLGEGEARTLAAERGWRVARFGGSWRRVVASPRPRAILEATAIERLVEAGVTVICPGGGGIPVIERKDGAIVAVDAVVDPDAASALLAKQLKADWFVMLTNVEAIYENHGSTQARRIAKITPSALAQMRLAERSMRPKAEAACDFVNETGGRAALGNLDALEAIIAGKAGTTIAAMAS